MNFNHSQDIPTTVGQSPGYDPKTSKRSSGLFSFFKWFKSSPSRESSVPDLLSSSSSSCDSINSRISTGTAASFSFVPPKSYQSNILEKKSIAPGPETDTYKARLKERDKRRERDKNLTLRKKYNLFFNRETLLRPKVEEEEDSSRSLPLMTRKKMLENSDEETSRIHRRTNSESSKLKKAGAYCHVKGKRKAPQPPINNKTRDSTLSLRRKKKLAPQPPTVTSEKIKSTLERLDKIEYADADVICNDSLKLDHGVLKSVTEHTSSASIYSTDSASSVKSEKPMEISPVLPRPWYKRNVNRESTFAPKKEPFKTDNKYEPIQRFPESVKASNSSEENKSLKNDEITKPTKIFGTSQSSKDDFKRKSGMTFLTNISELDREATEMIKKEHCQSGELDPPPFMRPKQEEAKNTDSWVSPKRKSAKDLIAKFNAITNVTKVTVNSTFFGSKEPAGAQKDNFKRDYFGRQLSVKDELLYQNKNNKKLSDKYFGKIDQDEKKLIENNKSGIPLMKSESAVVITSTKSEKKETPKTERKSWNCPKCSIENEYWRIICHVCSTIKPYFDDLSIPSPKNNSLEKNKIENLEVKHFPASGSGSTNNSKYTPFKSGNDTPHFERSKTQIGFSALSKINHNKNKENKFSKSVSVDQRAAANITEDSKREERERLKKVLIEMKNSLSKKKTNIGKQNFRSSIIQEKAENLYEDSKKTENKDLNLQGNENSTVSTRLPVKVEDKKVTSIPSAPEAKVLKNDSILSANSNLNIIAKLTRDNVLLQEQSVGIGVKNETKEKNLNKIQELTQKQSIVQSDKKEQPVPKETKKQNLPSDNRALNKKPHDIEPRKEQVAEAFIKTTETIYENIKVKKADNLKPTKVSSAVQTNGVLRKFSPENTLLDAVKNAKKNPKYELLRPNDFANIYNEMDSRDENHIYANLIQNGSLFLNMPVNFEDIRNNVANNTDTLEIGRLLKRLELAIAKGELGEAANYARELAQLKVNCSVIRQKSEEEKATARAEDKGFTIHMYVEDKISHRGPFPIKVRGSTTVSQLKLRVERDFEIPSNVQKWIIGKQLASDDNATMNELNIYDEGSPLFLYLVAPQKNEIKTESSKSSIIKQLDEDKEKNKPENKIQLPQTSKQSEEKKLDNKTQENKAAPDVIGSNKPQESAASLSCSNILLPEIKPDLIDNKSSIAIGKDIKNIPNNNNIDVNNAIAIESKQDQRLKEEIDDYDTRTLKPQNDEFWECIMCTLLNSKDSNVCAVCATIRRMTPSPTPTPNQPQKVARNRSKYKAPQPQVNTNAKEHYMQLVNLDNADLVENMKPFECLICFLEVGPGQGVTLRECLHQFCKPCLADTIQFSEEVQVKCPYRDEQYSCDIALQDREIKALVSKEIYDQYLGKSVAQAENKMDKSFHCKTPDCRGWCIYEDNVNEFKCPVCRRVNCLTCQAIHTGLNCKQYQERMERESSTDENAKRTRQMLDEMVNKGEALTCPTCQVILMKKWGCDWLRCSMCKTEICWVTRGPRWGPGGKGDTSGGCQCGVNGTKCHPQCNYCH